MSIMKRPEEVLMAVVAALFVVLTYSLARYADARVETALLVAALTLIVLLPAFMLWQRNRAAWLWPWLPGLLAACWWPYFDARAMLALSAGLAQDAAAMAEALPWYATWTFKLVLAVLPVAAGYGWMVYRRYYRKKKPL